MRVIIAGSRSITLTVTEVSEIIASSGFQVTELVCGMANGVDLSGLLWAKARHIPVLEMPADWKTLGRGAGMVRNKEMGDIADALIAVWDGKSRGTRYMIDYMNRVNKPVFTSLMGLSQMGRRGSLKSA